MTFFGLTIGSGFGEPGRASPPSIPRFTPQVKMLDHYIAKDVKCCGITNSLADHGLQ